MQKLSILLGLSGSEQSKFAAEVAWNLAERTNGRILAQHVIDSRTMWEVLRNDKPGFIGSGPYIAAYESICTSLKSLANSLTEKFEAVSQGRNISVETAVDEGSPVQAICARAKFHDLVIVGHQPRHLQARAREHCNYIRYAVAEGLAHECPRPLLVVQREVNAWKSMTILLSIDHVNFSFISACLEMAAFLGVQPNVVVLAGGKHEEPPLQFLKDLKDAAPGLAHVPVQVKVFSGFSVDDSYSLRHPEELQLDWYPEDDTLLVIPTRASGGERITIFDTTPDLFVRNLTLPSIMMWPEEHTELSTQSDANAEAVFR